MTREEFERTINNISKEYPFKHNLNYLLAHDAEQRAEIERLREALRLANIDQLTTEAELQAIKETP